MDERPWRSAEPVPEVPSSRPVEPPATGAARPAGATSSGLKLIIRTDGAARGNPGPASSGAALIEAVGPASRRPDAAPIASISEYLGVQTNNVAEYIAVVRALALAHELGAREVEMLLDSKLIVEQLHGRWRVKDAKLIPLHAEAKGHLSRFARWSAEVGKSLLLDLEAFDTTLGLRVLRVQLVQGVGYDLAHG
jgi:ribonuclease HI